jgi:hypothetical protein
MAAAATSSPQGLEPAWEAAPALPGAPASGSSLALPSLESIWGADLQPPAATPHAAAAPDAAATAAAFLQPAGRSRSRFQFAQDEAAVQLQQSQQQQQQLVFQQEQQQLSFRMQPPQQPWPPGAKPADAGRALLQQLQTGAQQPSGHGAMHMAQPQQQQPGSFFQQQAARLSERMQQAAHEATLAMGAPPSFSLSAAGAAGMRPPPPLPPNGYHHRGLPAQAQDAQGLEARWLDATQHFQNMAV